jgi:hypothetical protein
VPRIAIAGAILYSFRYYMVWDRKLQEPVWPKDIPRHVLVGILVAFGLIFVGVFISPRPL